MRLPPTASTELHAHAQQRLAELEVGEMLEGGFKFTNGDIALPQIHMTHGPHSPRLRQIRANLVQSVSDLNRGLSLTHLGTEQCDLKQQAVKISADEGIRFFGGFHQYSLNISYPPSR